MHNCLHHFFHGTWHQIHTVCHFFCVRSIPLGGSECKEHLHYDATNWDINSTVIPCYQKTWLDSHKPFVLPYIVQSLQDCNTSSKFQHHTADHNKFLIEFWFKRIRSHASTSWWGCHKINQSQWEHKRLLSTSFWKYNMLPISWRKLPWNKQSEQAWSFLELQQQSLAAKKIFAIQIP